MLLYRLPLCSRVQINLRPSSPAGPQSQLERWVEHSADAHGTGPPARAVLHQKRQNQGPPRPDLIHLEVRAAFDGLQTTS